MYVVAIDMANLQEDRGLIWAHDHGEPVAEVSDPDRVAVGVEDLCFVEAVLERGRGDDWILHCSKLTCERWWGQDLW